MGARGWVVDQKSEIIMRRQKRKEEDKEKKKMREDRRTEEWSSALVTRFTPQKKSFGDTFCRLGKVQKQIGA
jgi:hypothetical protein